MNQRLENTLSKLPPSPGVYKMKDADGKIIYIGKAINLRNRVRSYFQKAADLGDRKEYMVNLIEDIEYIEVGTDLEAFMLETNLIKQFRPKYNVLMKDDKNFVYIKVDTSEDFPRVTMTRKKEKDKAMYFGPKTAGHKVKQTLDILRKVLPFRHCGLNIAYKGCHNNENEVEITNKVIKYPCLYHYIKRCAAPCIGKVNPEEYGAIIDKVINFLKGKPDELIRQLKDEMTTYAVNKKFEKAATTRDKLKLIEEMFEKQRISDANRKDCDVLHFVIENAKVYVNLFQIRDGRIIGQENFIFNANHGKEEIPFTSEITEAIIRDYYSTTSNISEEILIPENIESVALLEKWLTEKHGKKVHIHWPQMGEKNKLLELSLANAKSFANQQKAKWLKEEVIPRESLESLAKVLNLPKPPKRIECYDISHFGGTSTVASMVVMINGSPANSEYRRFKLTTIPHGKPDDYASMREVLGRRLKYLQTSQYKFAIASKKTFAEIQKIIEEEKKKDTLSDENLDQKDFLCLLDNKKCIGFVRAIDIEKNNAVLRSLWIKDDYQGNKLGYGLMYQLMKKKSYKKYYIWIDKNLKEYYLNFGFQEIESVPEDFWKAYPDDVDHDTKNEDNKGNIIMMIETAKLLSHYKKFSTKPDLIVLDGGKGQLNIGIEVLKDLNINIPICSLAKEEEEIFMSHESESIQLPKDSHTLHLMQRIRDESHRFAVSYSNLSHNKTLISSELDDLPGIGELSKKKLLNHFGSLHSIKNATMDELARVVGKKAAMILKQTFQNPNQS